MIVIYGLMAIAIVGSIVLVNLLWQRKVQADKRAEFLSWPLLPGLAARFRFDVPLQATPDAVARVSQIILLAVDCMSNNSPWTLDAMTTALDGLRIRVHEKDVWIQEESGVKAGGEYDYMEIIEVGPAMAAMFFELAHHFRWKIEGLPAIEPYEHPEYWASTGLARGQALFDGRMKQ
jgi:hypothetical protein